MAQITNKCTDDDLDYFIGEASDILAITHNLPMASDPKQVLEYILTHIAEFKKLNQERMMDFGASANRLNIL